MTSLPPQHSLTRPQTKETSTTELMPRQSEPCLADLPLMNEREKRLRIHVKPLVVIPESNHHHLDLQL